MKAVNRLSKVVGLNISEELRGVLRSKSQQLFSDLGLVRVNHGLSTLSPFLLKSLRKLKTLVRNHMEDISALEILMPSLTESELLKKSGRLDMTNLLFLEPKHGRHYVLNSTCEESITDLLRSVKGLNHSQLPCRYFQISNKFRDEKRAKSGLIRAKEFVMKDLYCFDQNLEAGERTYKEVKKKYHEIFETLQLPCICVEGTQGDIGGEYSHEFHFESEAGDDKLILCNECGHKELLVFEEADKGNCRLCHSKNVKIINGIEVGHTFYLGTRYSEPFKATYSTSKGSSEFLHMSCYGLGLSRILAASVEILSKSNQIRWPHLISPYLLCIIPPKAGSKEEIASRDIIESLVCGLQKQLNGDVIIDDRISQSIGKRLNSVKELGIPFVLVIGKGMISDQPQVEIHDLNAGSFILVHINDVQKTFQDIVMKSSIS